MANLERRQLERLRHTPGQDLRSRDFRDQAAITAQLRWWHNRAEHDAYGVRNGLRTLPFPLIHQGTLAAAVVSPGVAYDAFGRELILARETRAAIPPADTGGIGGIGGVAVAWILCLRYVELDAAAGPCAAGGYEACGAAAPAAGTAELVWRRADRWRPADGVPLCRLEFGDGQFAWDVDFRPQLVAPVVQPRFATGATLPGGTGWTAWTPLAAKGIGHWDSALSGVQLWIDTRAAGFTTAPCYFAWLQGSLNGVSPSPIPVVGCVGRSFLTGFWFQVLPQPIPRQPAPSPPPGAAAAAHPPFLRLARQNLSVWWLGIEMPVAAGRPIPPTSEELGDVKP
jgi:hypothetical protein